jgi:hypothetical protein
VTYSKQNRAAPLVLFEVAKGMVTRTPPKVSDLRELGERELRQAATNELS